MESQKKPSEVVVDPLQRLEDEVSSHIRTYEKHKDEVQRNHDILFGLIYGFLLGIFGNLMVNLFDRLVIAGTDTGLQMVLLVVFTIIFLLLLVPALRQIKSYDIFLKSIPFFHHMQNEFRKLHRDYLAGMHKPKQPNP